MCLILTLPHPLSNFSHSKVAWTSFGDDFKMYERLSLQALRGRLAKLLQHHL